MTHCLGFYRCWQRHLLMLWQHFQLANKNNNFNTKWGMLWRFSGGLR
jgi:hypothetical protein